MGENKVLRDNYEILFVSFLRGSFKLLIAGFSDKP